ncbi:MAG: hypothetical protein ACO3PV_10860, partial [Pseudohongiellaceae bacterium]
FSRYYGCAQPVAVARQPFGCTPARRMELERLYEGLDRDAGMAQLQASFEAMQCRIPVLYRQYTSLFEDGGFQALVFNRDPDFGDCLDGLCLTDLTRLKPGKRARYIPSPH